MNRTKRAYWILGAALLALVAVCIYVFVVSNGKDADKAQTTARLDETSQSPRVQPLPKQTENGKAEASGAPESASQSKDAAEAEGAQASDTETGMGDLDKEARKYDADGQVGKPPEGWKEDYSHWDSNWDELTKVGVPQKNVGNTAYAYQPTEEDRLRKQELVREEEKAAADGLLSNEPKDGYIRLKFEENDTVYIAPSFIDRFNEIATEHEAIHERSMRPIKDAGAHTTNLVGSEPPSGFKIYYYRKPPNGLLIREVTLPNGKRMEFTAASSPDFSNFTEQEVEMMKSDWEKFLEKRAAGR